ncbi:hypothetical protein OG607_23745 [Streptomyces sp. NBC_01537]|uniref:trypco2 family protein n=1 Tax=Streptomyces sp. NBC_01537 TaxID=2903896 RepID=UPI00386E5337
MAKSDDMQDFGLDEVLAALGRDLVRASDAASGTSGYGLAVLEAEVELSFTVTRATGRNGKGKLRFEVVPESGPVDVPGEISTSHSEVRVHRIKLRLGSPTTATALSGNSKQATDVPAMTGYSAAATGSFTTTTLPQDYQTPYVETLRPVVERSAYGVPEGEAPGASQNAASDLNRAAPDSQHRPPDAY